MVAILIVVLTEGVADGERRPPRDVCQGSDPSAIPVEENALGRQSEGDISDMSIINPSGRVH
jgi:hypothetical protein